MKYKLLKDEFSNFNIYNRNKLDYRTYFIPYSDIEELKKTEIINERYSSDMVTVLNGDWKFKYYPKCMALPDVFDTEIEALDTVKVPSTWQRTGFENPMYLNTRYDFKLDPPNIPTNIPVAVYTRKIDIKDIDSKYIITFLGVCSTIGLYVNGKNIGYSEGSHNTAEFDITKFLMVGENELLVTVYKFSNGSYLECQDMFRENGIFRDVYLTKTAKSYLNDFYFDTKFNGSNYDLKFTAQIVDATPEDTLSVKIHNSDGSILIEGKQSATNRNEFNFNGLNVKEWNAEVPNLYQAILEFKSHGKTTYVRTYIGFKHIEIKGDTFFFNNKKIKIKGVNHHDTDSVNGWCMTAEQLLRDVEIIKKYNCNAVRMSHYPPDPLLLTLCDMYGLYVIDEMDIECHGIYCNPLNARFGLISDNLEWQNHFLDRAKAMFYRDRNHASITMWSLGNEAGGEKCHTICYDFFKTVTDIPVHYEGVIHTKRKGYDVVSMMYPPQNLVSKIAKSEAGKTYNGKPFFMCEFCHAMGVGPGGLASYWDIVNSADKIMGGCIWEFCDHAVYHEDGPYKYTYGGDHEEKKHDGNFCVDGLFFPDRTPSTGALNMREVFRPITCQRTKANEYMFTNTNRFLDSGNIAINYDILCNGQIISSGEINTVIQPEGKIIEIINEGEYSELNDNYLVFTYTDRTTNEYIASEQITLTQAQFQMPTTLELVKLDYVENDGVHTVKFNNGEFVFNAKKKQIASYKFNDVELINNQPLLGKKALLPNIYRGVIDNDRFIQVLWKIMGFGFAKPYNRGVNVVEVDNCLIINLKYSIWALGKLAGVTVQLKVDAKGNITVRSTIKRAWKTLFYSRLTRFGLTLEMPKEFDNVVYYGLGDKETLCDFNEHAILGIYNTKVVDMHERYVKPQESGNRTDVRYFDITNNEGVGLKFIHKGEFLNFNANHYVLPQLLKAKHTEDIKVYDTTNVQIDGFYRGTGSNSCGPGPQKDKKFDLKKPLTFEFEIHPIKK